MSRKSTSTYPDNWNEIARAVKDECGWRCVRCQHRHDPELGYTLTLGAMPLGPIVLDVAGTAQAHQVRESVRLAVPFKTELAERDDMSHGKLFREFVAMHAAMLASMAVAVPRLVSLILPVGAVVGNVAAFPVWALLGPELGREPGQSAGIGAEASRRLAGGCRSFFSARLALIRHAVRCASSRAIAATCRMRRLPREVLATPITGHRDVLRGIRASLRAVGLIAESSSGATERLPTSSTCLRNAVILAGPRTIDAAVYIPRRDAKWLVASRTNLRNHAGIIPYRQYAGQCGVVTGGHHA